ncbi:hypothetical protein ABT282_30860 [Streptomyces sp. NPDC000927]|uniref:hypothetical protein n=1 Tax=Streptomyces sp. NPDC000927 TaxID=3154371 RepID=UPI00331EB09E
MDNFDGIMNSEFPHGIDPQPYGNAPAPSAPVKAGLTMRGKIALGMGAAVIAGGSLVGWQAFSANSAESALEAKRLEIKTQQVEIERMRLLNEVNEKEKKAGESSLEKRQAKVEKCVSDRVSQFSGPYASRAVDDCMELYPAVAEMDISTAPAGESQASSKGFEIPVSGMGVGVAVVVIGAFWVSRKLRPAEGGNASG